MTEQSKKSLLALTDKLVHGINPAIASNRHERKAIASWNADRLDIAIAIRVIVKEEELMTIPPEPPVATDEPNQNVTGKMQPTTRNSQP